ncbi:hypothetical protein C4B60_09380 [Jeotgalibacillus proteolyticus]|uniref:Uncharacterized protein n=1 Tax=Jeotgalibacillus proteolyticus TaxID=2082395 RepID=A0A2S5GDL2_9BACL|nr:hypothetical protein C4B60_09380 [Jeotgalibacillus proteolyticus]
MSNTSFFIGVLLSFLSLSIYLFPGVELFWDLLMFIEKWFPIIAGIGILLGVIQLVRGVKKANSSKWLSISVIGIVLCIINTGVYYFYWNFS